jgi:hypothetical protein
MTEKKEDKRLKLGSLERGFRMRELTTAEGIAKSVIPHHMAQELLTEPVKTVRTMTYSGPECVKYVRLIKPLPPL